MLYNCATALIPLMLAASISMTRAQAYDHQAPVLLDQRYNPVAYVNLRVEGPQSTIFEGPIKTSAHDVTTKSGGGKHHCDGTNYNAHVYSGPTVTGALDTADTSSKFTFDGTYETYDDFLITRIGGTTQGTSGSFWGLYLGYKALDVGGCQQRVRDEDEVLFAFDAYQKVLLKAGGPTTAKVGREVTLTVQDGATGKGVVGAEIGGAVTGDYGIAKVTFKNSGVQRLKATQSGSIRSNTVSIVVTAA